MSFGDKRLDEAYDRWVTREPEEYEGNCDDETHELCEDCHGCHLCDDCEEACKENIEFQNKSLKGKK